jgi:predicted RecB family nuclease
MQHVLDSPVFSPSDLNHFLECEHLIQLELRRDGAPRPERDAHAELLAAKGLEHERTWLQRFRDEGRRIVEIETAGERNWERDAVRTLAAMRNGAEVIYQGVFVDDADQPAWRGISDFLVRVDVPSALGRWSYEAWDTKLARSSKPYFVLQLCFYSEQLARLQEHDPAEMHVILGTGQAEHFRYADFAAYYRAVRRRFLAATEAGLPTYPYPVSHCRLCLHEQTCREQWNADDHLSQLAGITREQVQRLNEAGIRTVEQFAGEAGRIVADAPAGSGVRIGEAALSRLHHQATLQAFHRRTRSHRYDLLPADARSGFRLMPEPSAGDIFFDMEGDPYFAPASGLEYLFGAITIDDGEPRFTWFQALTREQEKTAFEQFIDFVHRRLTQWPDLHVYHYAAYEITALKRLMSVHATREGELDDLLRKEVFVDLYQVVRQSLRISHNSYSIKKVRTFFMEGAGQGVVTDGGDSILQFEQFRATGDESLLQAIIDYNREDCVSTVQLRDWLLERKREAENAAGVTIPWKVVTPREENTKRVEDDALTQQRVDALDAMGEASATRLAALLGYHRREGKPEWWAHFDRRKKALDDLVDDTQSIAYLEAVPGIEPETVKQSLVYTLQFPDQEFKLSADPRAQLLDPFTGESAGIIEWLDSAKCQLGLKRGKRRAAEPLPLAICAGKPFDESAQRQALGRVADVVIEGRDAYTAIRRLLTRERPASAEGFGEADQGDQPHQPDLFDDPNAQRLQTLDLAEQKSLIAALDQSYLFIQGPPGSGKTWTGARLIVSLLTSGKRVGVAATSHKAINNLLREVEAVALAECVTFNGLKKGSGDDAFGGVLIGDTDENEEIEAAVATSRANQSAILVAGTAWLFSRPALDQALDYLFIDEAGQVALADAVAMGTAARNLVLLGDPQQLPQVRQGVHPDGSGCSVLEHLLAGAATVSEDRGLFLGQSWRMHPDVCSFISDLSYDGRLTSAPGRERQAVTSRGLTGTGLRYVPVEHSGNAQQSIEEARVIADHVQALLDGGTFTSVDGETTPLTPKDMLVVAPFNMQVRCLREQVPPGVEVGTVDKFQGREAPVVFFSMASSTGEDVPRGLEFLFSRNRFNVAISRAKALAVVVCSPRLLDVRCRTVEQMRLANMICRFAEVAGFSQTT